uniref:Uncharacterized protein n=1 Tax=Anguilla anguilla TaxID=7936 RepID=A0A0E9RZQ1_ANGAN
MVISEVAVTSQHRPLPYLALAWGGDECSVRP